MAERFATITQSLRFTPLASASSLARIDSVLPLACLRHPGCHGGKLSVQDINLIQEKNTAYEVKSRCQKESSAFAENGIARHVGTHDRPAHNPARAGSHQYRRLGHVRALCRRSRCRGQSGLEGVAD